MKALLMHFDRDFDLQQPLPAHQEAIMQDLELATLLRAMSGDDEFLYRVARIALLSGLQNDEETILHRQDVLKDCLKNPEAVKTLYDLSGEAIVGRKQLRFGYFTHFPSSILSQSVGVMRLFSELLRKLRNVAEEHGEMFQSSGFTELFALIRREMSDDYLGQVERHLNELQLRSGVLLSAELGEDGRGVNHVMRKPHQKKRNWLSHLLGKRMSAYTFQIAQRDVAGMRALSELRDRGINAVANALAQSVDHIESFFKALRTELAFYIGCMNLNSRLLDLDVRVSFPLPSPVGSRKLSFNGLCDPSLALTMERNVVSNSFDLDGKSLMVITGANQGGKSSFLRAMGLAQLMMHAGMFVAADSLTAELCAGFFTHYRREEDTTLKSGKLDEELVRMSGIVDAIGPDMFVLFNESFASTNEREGSEIARQIVRALQERGVKVFFVTHLYDFARSWFEAGHQDAVFLRAERQDDGKRTFRLKEGEPQETSFGKDLYLEMFASKAKENRPPGGNLQVDA